MKRRMAAIMVGDIVGYSAMMERSEEEALTRLVACEAVVERNVASLDGRIFNKAGDATLAEFSSPINALRCAVGIGAELAAVRENHELPLRMRFGVHLADVVERGDDLLGDGVNLAARLQQGAAPGAVWLSGSLFDQVRRNSPYVFDDLGERTFKNLSEPVRVYQVRGEIGPYRLQATPMRAASGNAKQPSSLAVMPFRVAGGGDDDQRFLAEGLTEELIVELGRFRRIRVASRSASFGVAASTTDPVKVGEALRVRYALDGQVRQTGAKLWIALTLAETDAGNVVWSDKIIRPVEEFWDSLDQMAAKIAATVVGRLEEASVIALRRRSPENYEAFECMLRGMDCHRLGGVTDDNARDAVKWFTKAIEIDANYATAYAWRVCALSWLPEFDRAKALADARKAIELDPGDPECNRILGYLEFINGNDQTAKALCLRAMQMKSERRLHQGALRRGDDHAGRSRICPDTVGGGGMPRPYAACFLRGRARSSSLCAWPLFPISGCIPVACLSDLPIPAVQLRLPRSSRPCAGGPQAVSGSGSGLPQHDPHNIPGQRALPR